MLQQKQINAFCYYLTILIAFLLPLNKRIIPPLIILLFISWLFHAPIKVIKSNLQKGWRNYLLPVLLYLLYVVSFFYSDNREVAIFDLQVKLSLLIFPFIIGGSSFFDRKRIKIVLLSFAEGCVAALILSLVYSGWKSWVAHDATFLFYDDLSAFHHPGYFAMYLCFSFGILFYYAFIQPTGKKWRWLIFFNLLLIAVFVLMLSSRAGIISLTLLAGTACLFAFTKYSALKVFIALAIVLGSSVALYLFSPPVQSRMEKVFNSGLYTSSLTSLDKKKDARLRIWETSLELSFKKPLSGYGSGDAKNVLIREYRRKEWGKLADKGLNAHNQVLQTALSVGWGGGVILIWFILQPLFIGLQKKNFLSLSFGIVLFVNIMTEAIFETQAGVVFFGLFYLLMLKRNHLERKAGDEKGQEPDGKFSD